MGQARNSALGSLVSEFVGGKELDMTEGFNNKFPQDRSRQWLIFVVVWLFCFVWVCLFWWSAEGVVTV